MRVAPRLRPLQLTRLGTFLHELLDFWPVILAATFLAVLFAVKVAIGPWGPMVTLRHMLAAPNCDAARLMDLAPAYRGQPWYYSHHDRDRDGRACEPYRRR
jgi:hypothetical protein